MRITAVMAGLSGIVFCIVAGDVVEISAQDPAAAIAPLRSEEPQWRRVSEPRTIAPPGWHRVDGNWQRIDGQPLPDPDPDRAINELIRSQRAFETATAPMRMLAMLMVYLRRLDPITLAAAEISAISMLAYRVLRREAV